MPLKGVGMKAMIMLVVLLSIGATHAADFKVGVVDTERVLREAVPAIKAEKKIEKEFSGRDQEIKRLMNQARDMQAQLEKEAGKPSDFEQRNKERELTALNVNLQRMQREFREDLNLRKNEELAIVLELANKAIQVIATEQRYDLILQEAVYRNPNIDITDRVLQHLATDKNGNNIEDMNKEFFEERTDSKAGY